ncbi:MAG: hypothetical protein Q4E88_03135 [Coriobacteriia bacterium]|nr:hypothetical protein [Coriobacteriia bacterium]
MDLAKRLGKDMLVLSGDVSSSFSELDNIIESDTIKNYYEPYISCGVQCLVANTKNCLKPILAHKKLDDKIEEISKAAIDIVNSLSPQHTIIELGSTGLPIDGDSKNSLLENKVQYVKSARIFENHKFDAYLLSDMRDDTELKCALMGIRQVSDKPIITEANTIATEFGAIPSLAVFDIKDEHPDDMKSLSLEAHSKGMQFLRAIGNARPAHAAVMVAVTSGLDVRVDIK